MARRLGTFLNASNVYKLLDNYAQTHMLFNKQNKSHTSCFCGGGNLKYYLAFDINDWFD